jgi:hypothetical protein
MKFNQICIATALAIVVSSSFADAGGGALDLSTGSTSFSRTPLNGFTDTWTFSLDGSSFLTSSTLSSSAVGSQDLTFASAFISSSADSSMPLAAFTAPFLFGANEFMSLSSFMLPAGSYNLVVKGSDSAHPAAYSGTITVMAIPEPETYALMMAGLAALGVVARGRRFASRQSLS